MTGLNNNSPYQTSGCACSVCQRGTGLHECGWAFGPSGVSEFQYFCLFANSALTEMGDLLFLKRKLATISVWQKQSNDRHLAHVLIKSCFKDETNLRDTAVAEIVSKRKGVFLHLQS